MVRTVVEKDFSVVRERIMGIPGKAADECEGKTRAEIEAVLEAECSEALDELSDPEKIAGRAVEMGQRR